MLIACTDNALTRAIFSDVARLPPSLDSQVHFAPGTHHLLRHAVAQAYLGLHPALRRFLARHEVSLTLAPYYEAVAAPQTSLTPGRKDNARLHRNQSPGLYDKQARTAYVFQYMLSRDIMPVIGQQPDPAAIADGIWHMNSPSAAARIARHEVWHAVDHNAGLPSRHPAFCRAWAMDVQNLGGSAAVRLSGWGYFIQDDIPHRGPSEVFAEIGASLSGGGVRGRTILQKFPLCTKLVRQFCARLAAQQQAQPPAALIHPAQQLRTGSL